MIITKNVYQILVLLTLVSQNVFCETNSTIDETSSASKKYTISGGVVDDSSAMISWSSKYNNGQLEIRWGTDASNLEYSKSLYPYRRATTAEILLDNLEPDTKYYYSVEGEWLGRYYTNLLSGSFKTKSSK